jgi:hypothetical protein
MDEATSPAVIMSITQCGEALIPQLRDVYWLVVKVNPDIRMG